MIEIGENLERVRVIHADERSVQSPDRSELLGSTCVCRFLSGQLIEYPRLYGMDNLLRFADRG